jgi:hypothetical protein
MKTEVVSFALNTAKNPASRTASRLCCRNGSKYGYPSTLKSSHLAEAAVQHEKVKRGNYDASLYFFCDFDNGADV